MHTTYRVGFIENRKKGVPAEIQQKAWGKNEGMYLLFVGCFEEEWWEMYWIKKLKAVFQSSHWEFWQEIPFQTNAKWAFMTVSKIDMKIVWLAQSTKYSKTKMHRKSKSARPCTNCCPRDLVPHKRRKVDGWIQRLMQKILTVLYYLAEMNEWIWGKRRKTQITF